MEKKILLAVDETDASRRAVSFVEEMFDEQTVSLTAVNVARTPVEWMPATPYGTVTAWPYAPGTETTGIDSAFARQEAVSQEVAGRQVPPGTTIEVAFGDAAEAIVMAADDIGADLIVVGSHEKGFLERLFRGSVSEEVVRKAPRPVLVVP
jgi:nucleotide-binding universal stress UspA family protein